MSGRFIYRAADEHPHGPNVLDSELGRWYSPSIVREMAAVLPENEALRAQVEWLNRIKFAFDEWIEKTNWVQENREGLFNHALGMHRADGMRVVIGGLRAENAALRGALVRAERKLTAYVGICDGDKELTGTVLPMVREALAARKEAR